MVKKNSNVIERARRVNEIFDEYSAKGYSNAWIYRHHIKKQFLIGYRTFYRYLKADTWETQNEEEEKE